VLTDGQVTNTDAVIDLVRRHANHVRIFTFGVGRAASHHLVTGLARAGGGAAEFIYPGERLEAKVMRQFTRLFTPALSDVRIEWSGLHASSVPATLPPIFANEPFRAYAWIDEMALGTVTLRATGPGGPLSWSLEIGPSDVTTGKTVGALAARARIRELEEGGEWSPVRGSLQRGRQIDRVAADIVRLATEYGLSSRETSWVVVETREVSVTEPAVLRQVPVAIASGWGGRIGREAMSSLSALDTGAFPMGLRELGRPAVGAPAEARLERSLLSGFASRWWHRARPERVQKPGEKQGERPLDRLIALQRADGSWDLDEELAHACGLADIVPVLAAALADNDEAQRALATALALTFLRRHASANASEWALLAEKAERWLRGVRAVPAVGGSWLDAASTVFAMARPV